MTELDRVWAESQIEGMADGTLSPDAEKRMLEQMSRDVALAARVEQARALRQQLNQLGRVPVPHGLFWRLWRIPAQERRLSSRIWMPAGFIAVAASVALAVNVFFATQGPSPEEEARAAMEDFAVAMAYLHKGTLMASNEVNEAVGSGMLNALVMSQGMLNRTEIDGLNGEQVDD